MTALAAPTSSGTHLASDLEGVFNDLFSEAENSQLIGGQSEPWYEPGTPSRLYYREDYFASALHEVAHWCIAGPRRRRMSDFGYWYAPEGRNECQQKAFEAVECKPQALEWFFSRAAGYQFHVSADNLSPVGDLQDNSPFKRAVVQAALDYQQQGLPRRAQLFFNALAKRFSPRLQPCQLQFDLAALC